MTFFCFLSGDASSHRNRWGSVRGWARRLRPVRPLPDSYSPPWLSEDRLLPKAAKACFRCSSRPTPAMPYPPCLRTDPMARREHDPEFNKIYQLIATFSASGMALYRSRASANAVRSALATPGTITRWCTPSTRRRTRPWTCTGIRLRPGSRYRDSTSSSVFCSEGFTWCGPRMCAPPGIRP